MSPFMTGLLLGMTIFSALSLQWAKAELAALQERNARRDNEQAQELAGALEFAMLSEGDGNASTAETFARARQFAGASARTRGGEEVQLIERTGEEGDGGQIALTASDDMFRRQQLKQAGNAEDLQRSVESAEGTALVNVEGVRARQITTSNQRMEALAEQVYAFYAAKLRFPDSSEYDMLQGKVGLRDAWGNSFDYTSDAGGQAAALGFTTPWGETVALPLSLK